MVDKNLTDLMSELMNMDRLKYIRIIMQSRDGARSIDIAEEISKSKGITDPEEIKKENIKVNKRLRNLVDLSVLVSKEGEYTISSLGRLLMTSWEELEKNAEAIEEFKEFFDNHYVDDLPQEFFLQMYKLRKAELTENSVQWEVGVREYMKTMKRKFYNMTEYLHDMPEEIIRKKEDGEIEEMSIIYQFRNYPELNYRDEWDLFDRLTKAGVEFRFMTLKEKHPIGIRIVDEEWATFGLARISDGKLDRGQAFVGTDKDFITWCRDLMYHMWHFRATSLIVEEVRAKNE